MTNPGSNERPYEAQHTSQETEAERVANQQKETQAANGEVETRNAGSMDAQNTPGPETQTR